jgi:hypothetical protein
VQDPILEKLPEFEVPKLTVPEGVTRVPESVSVTVAAHVVGALTTIGFGVHDTNEDVVRVPVDINAEPMLGAWSGSPPQLPTRVMLPVLPTLGVKVREHVTLAPLPLNGQDPDDEKVPGRLETRLTDPVGVIAVPLLTSATVTRHEVAVFTWTDVGAHETDTRVERCPTPRVNDCPLELADVACAESPEYAAPIS